MSRRGIIAASLGILFVAIIAIIIYRLQRPGTAQKDQSSVGASVSDSTFSPASEGVQGTNTVESDEPAELQSTTWTVPVEPALQPTDHRWADSDRPAPTEIPDTLRWNFFKPETRRDFSAVEKEMLGTNGFFLESVPAESSIVHDDMIDRYESHRISDFGNDYSTVPLFISSDLLLHVYHVIFDRALQEAEERKLYFVAARLSRIMLDACRQDLSQVSVPSLREAVQGNMAFFSVACSLLDTGFVTPSEVTDIVHAEVGLILSADKITTSPLLQTKEDYTQYVPRGHYTKTGRLSRYFRAMMWYGRSPFRTDSARHTLMAIQQTLLLSRPEIKQQWLALSQPFTYLVGTADDLTCNDYLSLLRHQSGNSHLPAFNEFVDGSKLNTLMRNASALRQGRVTDHPLPDRSDPGSLGSAYRFLGQRVVPDAHIFTRLTSPRVGTDEKPRNMPTALDVMSVLGSKSADELLRPNLGIPNYAPSLQALKAEYSGQSDRTWTQSVYWRWLDALRTVLKAKDDHFPYFMRTSQWGKKCLLTAAASWSELKHDTILMSKQSYAEMGEGDEGPPPPPQPKSYVEPDLEFFNRYIDLVQNTAKVFSDNNLLSEGYLQRFEHLLRNGLGLRAIVRKELMNAQISAQEYKDLLDYAGSISWTVLPEGTGDIIDNRFKQMALVADVHTDAMGGRALEEAVGAPQRIYVLIKDNSGGSRVCVGYVYSYYEFTRPIAHRMTDEEWKDVVYSGRQDALTPLEPTWISTIRAH